MKIYYGIPSNNEAFKLKDNEYEKFKNDFYNKKNIAIKFKNNYVKLIKNTKANSCGTCFFYKLCNEFLPKGQPFECCAYELIGEKEWRNYEFRKIEEYEVIFGE